MRFGPETEAQAGNIGGSGGVGIPEVPMAKSGIRRYFRDEFRVFF